MKVVDAMGMLYDSIPPFYKPLVEPKRIPTPNGYHSTREIAATLYSTMADAQLAMQIGQLQQHSQSLYHSTIGITYHIVKEKAPIYFVTEEFAEDVALTEPPKDFSMGDWKWPRDAMIIGFPTSFMKRYTGRDICYVYCVHQPAGEYRDPVFRTPTVEVPLPKIAVRFLIDTPPENMDCANLISVYKDTDPLEGIFERYTYVDSIGTKDDSDELCLNSVSSLIFKLLTIINLQPKFIQEGSLARPRSEHHGRVKEELMATKFHWRIL
jgi:hypothetical protein